MTEMKLLPGTIYTSRKDGRKYQVVTLAKEKTSGKELVVYQTLFEPFTTYAEPVEDFGRLVENGDRDEREEIECRKAGGSYIEETDMGTDSAEEDIHPEFRRFLDARGYAERIEILKGMRDVVDDTMINSIAVIMDMEIKDGPIGERFDELMECMHMKHRYEIERY